MDSLMNNLPSPPAMFSMDAGGCEAVKDGLSQNFNLANAKLNLSLKVVGRRSDGYHLLESLVVFLRLADDVEIGLAKDGCHQADGMHLYGINTKSIPNNDKNIAWRALAIINKDIIKNLPEYTLSLTKRIPSGAGLGFFTLSVVIILPNFKFGL